MSKIEGRAKKHDGTAIDYVSIFNWSDGKCIAQVTPDATGKWEYEHFTNLNIGLTYVADGCEPITHGSYTFEAATGVVINDYIAAYDFNGNTLDKSANTLNGALSGNASFVAGRKPDTQCINFVDGLVSTPVLPISSDKLSISFWIKTNQSSVAILMMLSSSYSQANAISVLMNENASKSLQFSVSKFPPFGANNVSMSANIKSSWKHIVLTTDRAETALGRTGVFIYVDNVDVTTPYPSVVSVMNNNFDNNELFIGRRASDDNFAFVGQLQDLRIYNRILSESERTALFSE